MSFEVGQVIAGEFKVIDVHVGGFSQVAIVEDQNSTRQALKAIRSDMLARARSLPEVQDQFQKECYVWQGRLRDCPHVARPNLSFRSFEGFGPVLFMEYVDGPSLERLRLDGGHLSIMETVRLGGQVSEALAYAHERDVLHRDIKPSNVLITRDNHAKLIDWGLVSVQEVAGFEGFTPDYAAPQRRANPSLADKKDDVYSFGAILYECLTGTLPDPHVGTDAIRQRLLSCEAMLPDCLLDLIAATVHMDSAARPSFSNVLAVLRDKDLQKDLARREIERPFCPHCGFVSIDLLEKCPLCGTACHVRIAQPVRKGMARIPAGTFTKGVSRKKAAMVLQTAGQGNPSSKQIDQLAPRQPVRVFLPAFDIDVVPVTNADFEAFCKDTNYPEPEGFAAHKVAFPNHPVVHLTWKDALCYAMWADKRLPLPDEWEKAARGDQDDRCYPWGDVWEPDRCNNNQHRGQMKTTEVGTFTKGDSDGRSPFGVADLVGNVHEWVADGKHFGMRGLRGGSWRDSCVVEGVVSFQIDADVDFHDPATGFRCAADIVYDEVEVAGRSRRSGPDE